MIVGSSDSGGVAPSPDHDRAQHPPVRPTGVEQRSDPVVLEVPEAEADAFDALDQVVEGFGRTVGHPGQVEVADLVEPALDGPSELLDLGRHGPFHAVALELVEHLAGLVGVARAVEVPQALLDAVGDGHLGVRVAQLEQ